MDEINLLDLYPRTKRPIAERANTVTELDRAIARQFDRAFFDGDRRQGYGGYRYDGRWKPVAKRISEYYGLTSQDSILDVGCAKGFALHDFRDTLPGIKVAGIDVSRYAISSAMESVKPYLCLANASHLPFPDKSFDLVLSINTIHNLEANLCRRALQEMERVSRKYKFVVVDSYRNPDEKKKMEQWNLTALTYFDTNRWKDFFKKAGYTGDFYWFFAE